MEQIGMTFAKRDWKTEIQELCDRLILKYKLPKGSLYLAENYGKGNNKDVVISHSITIYEPEYPEIKGIAKDPTRNTVIMNIKVNKLKTLGDRFEILIRESSTEFVGKPEGMIDKGLAAGTYFEKYQFDHTRLPEIIDNWLEYIDKLVGYELRVYESKAASFGCCSRFNDCSDARECVHENKLYACACSYKRHLDNGEIFYGKNKNI